MPTNLENSVAWVMSWKVMTNLDSILKSRDITLPTQVRIVKALFFLEVMYECESWTINEVLKNWCFWTVVLEKTLERVPWTARKSNQSILTEINPEYSLEGLKLKLKLQYFGDEQTHWKRPWCWERLKAGGEGSNRRGSGWMALLIQWSWIWPNTGR